MRGKEKVVEVSTGPPSISGRYERFNIKLGQGAFKTVYKAFDTLEQIDVAWNCIDLSCINANTEREKIFKECDILRKLSHPNILRIGDKWYNESEGHLNFITNIVHDGSLSKYFRNRKINLIRVKKIAQQILSALAYLHHSGIIHRDLKGDNIFIEGNTGNVVIGDLGLSCNVMSARSIVGTPHFMAPELFKEKYDEMVDIWSFGMIILELVTQKIPYRECKGAFQAYQKIIEGTQPETMASVTNEYVRAFIKVCIVLDPKQRPTATELLEHPFLLNRISDRILCHKCIQTKSEKYPEPPDSPIKHSPINPGQIQTYDGTEIKHNELTRTPTPNANASRPSTPTAKMSISQEKVVVEKVEICGNIYKIGMRIFSNALSCKIMTVEFDYDTKSDSPKAVADEMVKAIKLDQNFLGKIENAIVEAMEANPIIIAVINEMSDENDNKTEDESDKKFETEQSLSVSMPSAMSLNRAPSRERENRNLRLRQDTEVWLSENGLTELIAIFKKESLTMEHLRDISNINDMTKEMCDQFGWNIVTRLKLQKAVKDLKPVTPDRQYHETLKLEQTQILDALNRKHTTVSRDMRHIKDAINELEHSSKECNNAVRQNCDEMISLIEQDRDKLLQQIQTLKETRKKSLAENLKILQNINATIISTQQMCAKIANQSESQPFMRLGRIKQSIQTSLEHERKNHKFNAFLIDKSCFELKLSLDLQSFVDSIEQSMKLHFSQNEFELIYSNDPSPKNTNLKPVQSDTNLSQSTEVKAKVAIISEIKLDVTDTDFLQVQSPKNQKLLSQSHNTTNHTNKPIHTRSHSQNSGSIQSNYARPQHTHTPLTMQARSSIPMYTQSMNLKQLTLKASNTRASPTANVIRHDRDVLLVHGYIHKYCAHFPERVCNKTYAFYHLQCALIKFSKTYKSTEGWRFYDGQTCIKRLTVAATEMDSTDEREEYQNYKWILCELSHGGQSWCAETVLYRIWLRNPNKGLIVLGVCDAKRMFKSDKEHQSMVYGIGCAENRFYPINDGRTSVTHNNPNLSRFFNERQCQIDMKLNTVNGQLRFCVVSNSDSDSDSNAMKNEAIINGLPLNRNEWIPYFNSYQNSVGCQLKIALCPVSYYGRYKSDIFRQ